MMINVYISNNLPFSNFGVQKTYLVHCTIKRPCEFVWMLCKDINFIVPLPTVRQQTKFCQYIHVHAMSNAIFHTHFTPADITYFKWLTWKAKKSVKITLLASNTMQSYRLLRLTQPSHNKWDCNCKWDYPALFQQVACSMIS
jgi:hypothetical protein